MTKDVDVYEEKFREFADSELNSIEVPLVGKTDIMYQLDIFSKEYFDKSVANVMMDGPEDFIILTLYLKGLISEDELMDIEKFKTNLYKELIRINRLVMDHSERIMKEIKEED